MISLMNIINFCCITNSDYYKYLVKCLRKGIVLYTINNSLLIINLGVVAITSCTFSDSVSKSQDSAFICKLSHI